MEKPKKITKNKLVIVNLIFLLIIVFFISSLFLGHFRILSGLLLSVMVILKIRSGTCRQRQILNILYAKNTYAQLSIEDKKAVLTVCLHRLREGGFTDERAKEKLKTMDNLQRYGLYALAMAELQIQPIPKTKYWWSYIERPMIISDEVRKEIPFGIEMFYRDHKVKLDLEL